MNHGKGYSPDRNSDLTNTRSWFARRLRLRIATLALLGAGAGRVLAIPFTFGTDPTTGAITGGVASAINASGQSVSPLISVVNVDGAQFTTGQFDTAPFISSLEWSFVVNPNAPILSFNFSLPQLEPDPSGLGSSPFLDSFAISLFDGTRTLNLLLVDSSGAVPDPFGTAPGTVALGPSLISPLTFEDDTLALGLSANSPLRFTVKADLSSIAGTPLSLNIDAFNADDGFSTSMTFDSATTEKKPKEKVPDRGATGLLALVSFGGLALIRRLLNHGIKPL